MGNNARKAEKRAEWEAEQAEQERADAIERARKAELTMWGKIEEVTDFAGVREILHELAEKAGLE